MGSDRGEGQRVAVVTGAARGIGRAVAAGLLDAGYGVAALDRSWDPTGSSNDAATRTRDELESGGALVATVDVTDAASIRTARDLATSRFGQVDVLVNNAAMRMREVDPRRHVEVLASEVDDWRRMLEVNVLGPLRMIQQYVPAMIARGHGNVVNVSSSSGSRGMAGDNPYGASKAALTNLSQSLAEEVAGLGVAVHVVFPGITRTTGFEEQNALHPSPTPTDGLPVFRPESVVPLVLWLADQDVSSSGQTFAVADWLVEHGHGPLDRWLAETVPDQPLAGKGAPC